MPAPVRVAMHVVKAIQVSSVDTPVHYVPVDVDVVVVNVIDPATAPVPASVPTVIPPGPQRHPGAERKQAAGDQRPGRWPIHVFWVVLGYINHALLRRHNRNVPLLVRDCLLSRAGQSARVSGLLPQSLD